MGRFEEGRPITQADEVRFYLNNAGAADEGYDEKTAEENERLEEIADESVRSHSDALTVIIIAFVMLFFGTVFVALTDHQDYSEREKVTAERLVKGSFLLDVEKKFNGSLPLQDYFHNAKSAITYCFGLGNETDFIDIESKKLEDDPYSVIDGSNEGYTPINSNPTGGEETDPEETSADNNGLPEIETTSNGKNRKIKGITLTTLKSEDEMLADDFVVSTLNRDAPMVTNNGFSPYKKETETSPTETTSETSSGQTSSNDYFYDPKKPTKATSATEPPPESSGDETGEPSETQPTEPVETQPPSETRPTKTQNPYLVPAG